MFLNRLLTIGMLTAVSMNADVTLRYKATMKFNPTLPAQMVEQATSGMKAAIPTDMTMQLKEGKGASSFGKLRSIVDFTKGQITLIDPEKKRVATLSSDQLADAFGKMMADMPPEAKAAMAAMKVTTDTKVTGRTETIQGIQAEEREVTMSIEGPAVPNMPPGPMIKMAIQFWTAKEGEAMRVPALREMAGYNVWAYATMNPAGSIEKMMQQMPGMGDGIGMLMKDMQAAKSMLLRSTVRMWMPAVAAMMKQMPPEKNPFGAGFDAEAPFMEMSQEIAELSTAEVPASVFAVPEGYEETSAAEMVRAMMPKSPSAK